MAQPSLFAALLLVAAVVLLLLLLPASAAVVRGLRHHDANATRRAGLTAAPDCLPASKDIEKFLKDHYSDQHRVVDYNADCGSFTNAPCVYPRDCRDDGCSLYFGVFERCLKGSRMHAHGRCAPNKFIYTDTFEKGHHVVAIAFEPIRGIEDVKENSVNRDHSATFFSVMWGELLAGHAGGDLSQQFELEKGALVINPPAHREYHQMHIHAGTYRTTAFQACVDRISASAKGEHSTCDKLSEAGAACGGQHQPPCQTAVLVSWVVDYAHGGLEAAWELYLKSLDILVPTVKGSTPLTAVPRDVLHYHAAVTVTRGKKLQSLPKNPNDFAFVVVYAPVDADPHNGLGRGHFVCRGTEADKSC